MSDLVARGHVTVGDGDNARDLMVYEITPVQMRQVLLNLGWPGAEATPDEIARYQISQVLFEDCSLDDLALFTRLPADELEAMPPSYLRKILAKAKELNPDFFGALERLASRQSKL